MSGTKRVFSFLRELLHILPLAVAVSVGLAQNWPGWRGPGSSGVSDNARVPIRWSQLSSVKWRTPIPGFGLSSPIVWGNRVFLTTAIREDNPASLEFRKGLYITGKRDEPDEGVYEWVLLSIDLASGKILWQSTASKRRPPTPRHLKNSLATETPVTDGERVYVEFGTEGLFCFDYDGKLIWKREPGSLEVRNYYGSASSPILFNNTVIVFRAREDESKLLAIDKRTGKTKWQVQENESTSYSTPFITKLGGRTELITSAPRRVRSYDPETGKLYWECGGMTSVAVPTPVAGKDLVFVSSGYQSGPIYAIRPSATGDLTLRPDESTNRFVAWSQKSGGPYITSPILFGDYLYVLMDRGFLTAYEAGTGERAYHSRIETGAIFSASPVAAGGRIYCLSEDGDTYVIKAGPVYELLAKNSLGEVALASPAIAGDSILIRTLQHLYRIGP